MSAPLADLLVPALAGGGGRVEDMAQRQLAGPEILALGHRNAEALRVAGVRRGEPVHVLIDNRAHDLAALLGVWLADAVAVPVHAGTPGLVQDALRRRTGARIAIDALESRWVSDQPPPTGSLPDGAALVVFTSGTTGRPKGVVLGHAQLAGKLEILARLLDLQPADRVVVPLRLSFIFGIWVALLTFMTGARLTLLPRFDGEVAESCLAEESVLAAVPTMLRMLLGKNGARARLRAIVTGGELLPALLARAIRTTWPEARLFDLYGLTETGSCDFCLAPGDQPDGDGTIGRPTEGVIFRIAGEDGAPIHDDSPGELQIESRFGMLGYLDDPELSARAFSGSFFRTGDLARRDAFGRVQIVGRIKEIISRGGMKIAPAEIERLLEAHPGIEGALCGGVPDPLRGEAVHALVVPRRGERLDLEALRDWLGSRIERYKLPDALHVVAALPVGPTGKLDRRAIPGMLAMPAPPTDGSGPG